MTEIVGTIHTLFEVEVYNDFRKRVVWIQELNKKNPCHYSVEFWHDDIKELHGFKVGDSVKIKYLPWGKMLSKRNSDEQYILNIFLGKQIQRF